MHLAFSGGVNLSARKGETMENRAKAVPSTIDYATPPA
jgi:hypothetical protein